jgi:hypothetical protein
MSTKFRISYFVKFGRNFAKFWFSKNHQILRNHNFAKWNSGTGLTEYQKAAIPLVPIALCPPSTVHCFLLSPLSTANCPLFHVNCPLLAHCLLTYDHCPLPTVHCPLHTTHCSLPTAQCLLRTVYCPLFTGHYLLSTVHCSLFTVHCPLFSFYCPLSTTNCLLCMLYTVESLVLY